MFVIIYSFKIYPNKKQEFIKSWTNLTEYIYQKYGSKGSKLHKESEDSFIAYAQWPSKEILENSKKNKSKKGDELSQKLRKYCLKVEILYEMDTIIDLLKN